MVLIAVVYCMKECGYRCTVWRSVGIGVVYEGVWVSVYCMKECGYRCTVWRSVVIVLLKHLCTT